MKTSSASSAAVDPIVCQLVSFLRRNQSEICGEWIRRVRRARLVDSKTFPDFSSAAEWMYDYYVHALECGGVDGLRAFLGQLPDRLRAHGINDHCVLAIVFLFRDVLNVSLFREFRHFELMRSTPARAALDEIRATRETERAQPVWAPKPEEATGNSLELMAK